MAQVSPKKKFCLFHAFNPFKKKLYQNPVQFFFVISHGVPLLHSNVLQYYVKREKFKVNDVIFPSGCEARAINLGNKNMKISIFTGATSVRSKNIFTDIFRYPTGKHEINIDILEKKKCKCDYVVISIQYNKTLFKFDINPIFLCGILVTTLSHLHCFIQVDRFIPISSFPNLPLPISPPNLFSCRPFLCCLFPVYSFPISQFSISSLSYFAKILFRNYLILPLILIWLIFPFNPPLIRPFYGLSLPHNAPFCDFH